MVYNHVYPDRTTCINETLGEVPQNAIVYLSPRFHEESSGAKRNARN